MRWFGIRRLAALRRLSRQRRLPALLSMGIGATALGFGLALAWQAAVFRGRAPQTIGWPWACACILVGSALVSLALYQWSSSGSAPSRQVSTGRAEAGPGSTVAAGSSHLPRIVALGGGHGLSTLLRGLKACPCELTAIVTVADDGGSSGVLRREFGMLPPGDLRRCIGALADAEPLMSRLFEYRFGRGAGLDGHAFGNLFIAAMAGVTGDFTSAISEAGRVLAVRGRILPSSLDNVVLMAEIVDDAQGSTRVVRGESAIAEAGGTVERVFLQPDGAKGFPEAVAALLHADAIVMGPGSLFTSVLPNLLVADISAAVKASPAFKIYVCNVATQPGETTGYCVGDHVSALSEHLGARFCDVVLGNASTAHDLPEASGSVMVRADYDGSAGCELVLEDLVDQRMPWRHDSAKLAAAIMALLGRRSSAGDDRYQ